MKTNFTAKTAKGLRTIANNEHKGMNAAYRTLKSVWESNNTDLTDAIEAAKNDGLTIDDFTASGLETECIEFKDDPAVPDPERMTKIILELAEMCGISLA